MVTDAPVWGNRPSRMMPALENHLGVKQTFVLRQSEPSCFLSRAPGRAGVGAFAGDNLFVVISSEADKSLFEVNGLRPWSAPTPAVPRARERETTGLPHGRRSLRDDENGTTAIGGRGRG
jgi:hypothetical protein